MNNKKRNIIIGIVIIFISILTIFSVNTFFNKKSVNKNEKYFDIVYLIIDKNKTSKDAKLSDMRKYKKHILTSTMTREVATKEKNYYKVKIKNTNKIVFNDVTDYVFALNDLDGNVVTDLKYNEKAKTVYIPKKYYESEKYIKRYKNRPLKMEFVSRITKKEYKNVNIKSSVSKILTSKKNYIKDGKNSETLISIFKYRNRGILSKNDIKIYINDGDVPLQKEYYEVYPSAGTVKIDIGPLYIDKIDVKVNKFALFKRGFLSIFSLVDVDAATTLRGEKYAGSWSLSGGNASASDFINKTKTITAANYAYGTAISWYNDGGSSWKNGNIICGTSKIGNLDGSKNFKCDGRWSYSPISNYPDLKKAVVWMMNNKARTTAGSNTHGTAGYDCFLVDIGKIGDKHFTVDDTRLDFDIDTQWIQMWCEESNVGAAGNRLDFEFTIDNISGKVMTISVESTEKVGSQIAHGNFKLYKDTQAASLKVKKYTYDAGLTSGSLTKRALAQEDIKFTLYDDYSDGDCSGKIDSGVTNSSGVVTFKGLETNESYCVKEEYSELNDDSEISSYEYIRTNRISTISTVTPVPGNTGGAAVEFETGKGRKCTTDGDGSTSECEYYNTYIRYCVLVNKKDLVTRSGSFQDGTVRFCDNKGNCKNIEDDEAMFCGYHYSDIKNGLTITESSSSNPKGEGDEDYYSTLYNSSGSPASISFSFNDAFPMDLNHDSSGYWWSEPSSTGSAKTGYDLKKYYCSKVTKKDQDTGSTLAGAEFSIECDNSEDAQSSNSVANASGVATLYAGYSTGAISCRVTEEEPPVGYALSQTPTIPVTPSVMSQSYASTYAGRGDSAVASGVNTWCQANAGSYNFENPALNINWYKVTEDEETRAPGAKFTVSGPSGKIYHKAGKVRTTNADKTESKMCYEYSATSTGSGSDEFESDENGEVCVRAVPEGDYTVTEIQPAEYHTFGEEYQVTLETSTDFEPQDDDNSFINLPTQFRFYKSVLNTDGSQEGDESYTIIENGEEKDVTLSEMTTEQLKLITFKIYRNNNPSTPLYFVLGEDEDGNPMYTYAGTTPDGPSGSSTTELHLNDDRQIYVEHLPHGSYSIKEYDTSSCRLSGTYSYPSFSNPSSQPSSASSCSNGSGNSGECIGYYSPNYSSNSSHQFTIGYCSNTNANATACSNTQREETQSLQNKPTEVTLTKRDFYSYDDAADIIDYDRAQDSKETDVEFENDKERSDFDRIDFKVKDPTGRYLNFIYVGKHGNCSDDSSYSIYRYIPNLSLPDDVDPDMFNPEIGGTTQTLHACGGHIKIINLCRGNKYTFEEMKVPDDSVYVREDTASTPTTACFTIPCTDETATPTSETHIIKDKGTRVRFEKRDSKYNYLIPDETTTFQVYRCPKDDDGTGLECHPGDYATEEERIAEGMKLMKFTPRAVISGDQEDPRDAEGLAGVEVYNGISDSDAKSLSKCASTSSRGCYVVDLHPYHGILVLRYLQASENDGYKYVLLETVAPKNYMLPIGEDAETAFTITNQTVSVDSVDVPNKPTSLLIRKYSDKGELLPGAEFKVYQGTANNRGACDAHLSPMNQPKELMKFKTIRDGVYEWRPELTDEIVKTCNDINGVCSGIPTNESTDLTYSATIRNENLNNTYEDSWADWINTQTEDGTEIEIQQGEALIQYLEYGHCYIIEEVKAPDGYSLPSKDEDRYSMVYIEENDSYYHDTKTDLINKPTPFTFYKFDEFNQLLDGAEFKLQKLDDNKKYHDVPVDLEETKEDGSLFYKVNDDGDNYTILTHNGKATVYFLRAGQYRIVETSPAPGKQVNKNPNVATFFVDSEGRVFGNAIIVNKAPTERVDVKPTARAELIVNIQTGQTVIKYGLIISVLTLTITGLMIYNNKKRKK